MRTKERKKKGEEGTSFSRCAHFRKRKRDRETDKRDKWVAT